ncbi:uncharacterized protein A4U43_C02F15380 [Asparagus officinalis]|uniref:Ycf54-like protein n=1 Tax=Asparagus officinalis TaxID=4686 RepID=A0A5P1FNH6_ASPOF|nr:uncharacterized protein LOC109831502 [Asparagus officinalis]ONK78180.1 uncharacterized protein A4U43_C02F15380 [Asparagus officinalis]
MAITASLSLRPYCGPAPAQPKRGVFSTNPLSSPSLPRTGPFPLLAATWRRSLSLARAISTLDSPPTQDQEKPKKYYFLVANAKFMLDEEEHFRELLFERLRNYGERNKEQDFWLVIEPKFLERFPEVTKRLKRPAVALVSTDSNWITFMKLRLDRVLAENFEAESFAKAMVSNPIDLQFEKPEKWVAPYPKYEYGWWESFLPKETSKTEA